MTIEEIRTVRELVSLVLQTERCADIADLGGARQHNATATKVLRRLEDAACGHHWQPQRPVLALAELLVCRCSLCGSRRLVARGDVKNDEVQPEGAGLEEEE